MAELLLVGRASETQMPAPQSEEDAETEAETEVEELVEEEKEEEEEEESLLQEATEEDNYAAC